MLVYPVNCMAKQIEYPADMVDAKGNVWATVGENIRNGESGLAIRIAVYVRTA